MWGLGLRSMMCLGRGGCDVNAPDAPTSEVLIVTLANLMRLILTGLLSLLQVRAEGGTRERRGWALTADVKNCARDRAEKIAFEPNAHQPAALEKGLFLEKLETS